MRRKQEHVRQHKKLGLQAPFEGPFDIEERVSRSTVKLHVGNLKDGTKRFEIRHVNDLKFPHPDSLAAPIHRPRRGRPSLDRSQVVTDANSDVSLVDGNGNQLPEQPLNRLNDRTPTNADLSNNNKQTAAKIQNDKNEWQSTFSGPPSDKPFSRPVRATCNPSPRYVDAIWAASAADIEEINKSINARAG